MTLRPSILCWLLGHKLPKAKLLKENNVIVDFKNFKEDDSFYVDKSYIYCTRCRTVLLP